LAIAWLVSAGLDRARPNLALVKANIVHEITDFLRTAQMKKAWGCVGCNSTTSANPSKRAAHFWW
jgi:hypothetical protein